MPLLGQYFLHNNPKDSPWKLAYSGLIKCTKVGRLDVLPCPFDSETMIHMKNRICQKLEAICQHCCHISLCSCCMCKAADSTSALRSATIIVLNVDNCLSRDWKIINSKSSCVIFWHIYSAHMHKWVKLWFFISAKHANIFSVFRHTAVKYATFLSLVYLI